jgi:hypothetical protein
MTVAEAGQGDGTLVTTASERVGEYSSDIDFSSQTGLIHADFSVGADVVSTSALKSNGLISGTGLILGSRGFVLTREERDSLISREPQSAGLISPLSNGRDLLDLPRKLYVIDTYSLGLDQVRSNHPAIYQRLFDRVYPERQTNRDPRSGLNGGSSGVPTSRCGTPYVA